MFRPHLTLHDNVFSLENPVSGMKEERPAFSLLKKVSRCALLTIMMMCCDVCVKNIYISCYLVHYVERGYVTRILLFEVNSVLKEAVSLQSSSFCFLLPVTHPQSLWNLK